jgi:putative hydrolase of the HAD superfamily
MSGIDGGSRIQAVIFDFGGVICFPPNQAQWREAAAFCRAERHAFEAAFWEDRDAYDCGQDPRLYWTAIGARLGLRFDDATIDAMIEREIAFWSLFDERVLRWTRGLRAAGIRTGILSNLPRPIGERLKSLPGFLAHFDEVTFSYELGVVKPQAAIYQAAVRGLGIDPGRALFLDDRAANVHGARALGLVAEIFTTWEDFLAGVRARHELPEPA